MERDVINLRAMVRHVQPSNPARTEAVGLELVVQITHDLDAEWIANLDMQELGKQENLGIEWLFDGTFSSEPNDDPEVMTPSKVFRGLATDLYTRVQAIHKIVELIKEAVPDVPDGVGHA